jgi:hypothetical protein
MLILDPGPLRGTWDIEIISLLTQAWENQLHN